MQVTQTRNLQKENSVQITNNLPHDVDDADDLVGGSNIESTSTAVIHTENNQHNEKRKHVHHTK